MSKNLRGSGRTTVALRRAIQKSPESIRSLARRYGINPKTVARWKQRESADDLKTGPKQSRSSVLSIDEEALIVAFRQHLVLPLDDCLGALQSLIPHLTRSSLHRCLQRHGISRQPEANDDESPQAGSPSRPPGQFRLQMVQIRLLKRQLQLFVAVTQSWDTSRLARVRDPESTREAILEAARTCLAHDGPEGLSLAEVARIAGVNRGTAYQHFKTRENLIAATAEWVSGKLFHAVFGDAKSSAERRVGQIDVAELTDRLSAFAMDNPELCRAWLLQVLSSPTPAKDLFWREYQGSTARFATTDMAQENVDAEVLSVIMLAGAFLWPVWARAHTDKKEDMRPLAHRFAQECLRISMYGNLRSEQYPQIARRLKAYRQSAGEQ